MLKLIKWLAARREAKRADKLALDWYNGYERGCKTARDDPGAVRRVLHSPLFKLLYSARYQAGYETGAKSVTMQRIRARRRAAALQRYGQ